MKKKFFFLSLMIILVGYSCQNEIIESTGNSVKSGGIDVAEARSFFETTFHSLELPIKGTEDESICKNGKCTVHHHDKEPSSRADESHSHFPELKKSNIFLEWNKVRSWSDEGFSYLEVPLNTGGQLFALKKMETREMMNHERSKVESMLVFRKSKEAGKTECYVVTLVEDKNSRKNGKNKQIQKFTHRPKGSDFSGFTLFSTVEGELKYGLKYESGVIISRLTPVSHDPHGEKVENTIAISLFDMSVNKTSYSLGWEYGYCDECWTWHILDFDCPICIYCGSVSNECQCSECFRCWTIPCICCNTCERYPCRCCEICKQDYADCTCCPICKSSIGSHCSSCKQCRDRCACCYYCGYYPCKCKI